MQTSSDCFREELNEKDELLLSLNVQLKQLQVRFSSHKLLRIIKYIYVAINEFTFHFHFSHSIALLA